MFRGKHQPPLTPSFFLSYYLIPSPTCLSTVNNTGPAVGARHLLLPGSRLVIGRRSDKQTLSRLVRVLTATHSQFSSALTQLGTALALCCAFWGGTYRPSLPTLNIFTLRLRAPVLVCLYFAYSAAYKLLAQAPLSAAFQSLAWSTSKMKCLSFYYSINHTHPYNIR